MSICAHISGARKMQVVLNWEKGISEYQSDFSNIQMQIMWMHKASQMGDIQEICSGGGK